jgi:SPRY domain
VTKCNRLQGGPSHSAALRAVRWDEGKAGKDLHVLDGLTVTKMSNEGGDYATTLGNLSLASGQHTWNIYINHVEDSNLFIGVTVGGHDLNADPQEMKHRTYYLSNGTIRVAGKLVTRCAEPYAEGDLITVQLDLDLKSIAFLKNGVQQGMGGDLPGGHWCHLRHIRMVVFLFSAPASSGAGGGIIYPANSRWCGFAPAVTEELWPYVSLDNIMDSITLHSSNMFADLAHSLRWNGVRSNKWVAISPDGKTASLKNSATSESPAYSGQASILGLREYSRTEVHSWVLKIEQVRIIIPACFLRLCRVEKT